VAGVSLDRRDNDPVVLVPYLAAALDRVEPVDPGLFPVLASPGGSVVPQLVSSVVAMTEPVTVVLDQLESLENRVCLDALAELALGLPAGSQLLLGSRPCRWPCCGPRAWGGGRGGRAGHGPDREPGPAGGDRGRPVRCA
jgi:ATP/maltotriose-dependent transcriptional regulator MalT